MGGHPDPFRSFAAGSRQAPDPHDQFLEKENFYRKHTPRDASSLFRCISEQLFDTQTYFRRVREECCTYMLRNREYFESHVDGDFDEYMEALARLRTRGTLLELRALAYRYQRNVILFEPYTLGNHFIMQPRYSKSMFQVFVTPDYHFDSVYKMSEIEDAAFCQSLIYDVLYTNVFRLPDVAYAVERMLHDPVGLHYGQGEMAIPAITDGSGDDRRLCDQRMNTYCILEDYRMCHFHNESFDEYLHTIGPGDRRIESYGGGRLYHNNGDQHNNYQAPRYEGALLKSAEQSCVRQLLNEGITPFPYKVAKALDPYIYRNIEFDVWSDLRKQYRMRFTYRRYINVGDKCFIRLNDGDAQVHTAKQQRDLAVDGAGDKALVQYRNPNNGGGGGYSSKVYVGYVQHIEKVTNLYHVYVEELGERLVVQGSILRACNNVNHHSVINGHRRDFTVIGLSDRSRMFDNYHWRSPKYYGNEQQRSQQPYALLRGARNGNGHYRFPYQSPFYRPRYNRHETNEDDDMRLLKNNTKNSNHSTTTPLEKTVAVAPGNIFEDKMALKELLYSPCYDSRCNYYNEIVAMPAFITGNNKISGGGGDPDENNNTPKKNNNDHLFAPSNEVAFENNSRMPTEGATMNEENSVTSGMVSELVDEEGMAKPTEEGSIVYGQFNAVDPNAFYTVASTGQQFLTNATPTFYMPAAPMDMQGSTYYPCYRGSGPQYYYNYVYSSATGTSTTSTMAAPPYVMSSPGGQSASYISPPVDSSNAQYLSILIQRRDLLQSDTPVNINAQPSYSAKGQDLPVNDMGTLRFYYNLGIEYFAHLAAVQGASNALNSLQNDSSQQLLGIENGAVSTDPQSLSSVQSTVPSATASPPNNGSTADVDNELKELSLVDGSSNSSRGNNAPTTTVSTDLVAVDRSNHSGTRNSTPSSHSDSGGNAQQQQQHSRGYHSTGYNRRPPFNGGRGFGRGGNNMGYRGGMGGRHLSAGGGGGPLQSAINNGGGSSGGGNFQQGSGSDKGKDSRPQGNNINHHNNNQNNNTNRRHGPGRFNHHYNNNGHSNFNTHNNIVVGHRKPVNQQNTSEYQGDNRSMMGENKSQSQSPFRNMNNHHSNLNKSQQHQTQSPIRSGGMVAKDSPNDVHALQAGSPYAQQQQHGNMDAAMMMNQQVYGQPAEGGQQLMTPPINYYGSQVPPFTYSGPPPHLPPPFGNASQNGGNNAIMNTPSMAGPQPQPGNVQPTQQQAMYNSPYYATTYTTYIPVDLGQQQPMQPFQMGVLPPPQVGEVNAVGGGANVVVGPMSFVPQNPYPHHLMGQNNIGTPPNYFVPHSISAEAPGTPTTSVSGATAVGGQSLMSCSGTEPSYHGSQQGVPWSSGGGTPGVVNSGPSSGIGSTESSPPYIAPAMSYNQHTPTGYAYPFPPPHQAAATGQHHQQHFWYAPQQQPAQGSVSTPPQDGKAA